MADDNHLCKIPCKKAITTGICKADCCGIFAMTIEFIEKYSSQMQMPPIRDERNENLAFLITDDFYCVFLNRTTYLCSIYANRPWVCRVFGTNDDPAAQCDHYDKNGDKRTRADRRRVQRQHDHGFKRAVREAKRMILLS